MKIYTNRKTLLKAGNVKKDLLVDDFERKLARTKRVFIKELSIRAELMRRACDFKDFHALHLDDNSMKFFHNSTLLVKFFQEIAVENVSLSNLGEHDVYKSYSEHINILEEVLGRYLTQLYALEAEDMIAMPLNWWKSNETFSSINLSWAKSQGDFELFYDGILSKFDLSLVDALAKTLAEDDFGSLTLFVHTDAWFQKSILRLDEYGDLEADKIYSIDAITKKVEIIANFTPKTNAELNVISMKSMFGSYIRNRVEELVNDNVKLKDIAVVYSDDSVRPMLELYADDLLSFDHTQTLADMKMMRILDNIITVAAKGELKDGLSGTLLLPEAKSLSRHVSSGSISLDFISNISRDFDKNVSVGYVIDLFGHLAELSETPTEHDLIISLIELLERNSEIFDGSLLREVLEFSVYQSDFMKDELHSEENKVRAYDFIDTRGVSVKHLIVVGFEKGLVPRPAKKDLFLDTNIRITSDMPIFSDRIDMQCHYWQSLFTKADSVCVCYHDGDKADVSLFAAEFGLKKPVRIPNDQLVSSMFSLKDVDFNGVQDEIKATVPKKRYLSSTKLTAFLDCKRKYYYKYIEKIGEPVSYGFMKEERETGLAIHTIMEHELVNIHDIPKEEMIKNANEKLAVMIPSSATSEFNVSLWKKRLDRFISFEYEQISKGAKIDGVEKEFSFELNNITYSGIVDRIDTGENDSILVSDYKTGKTPALKVTGKGETNFQPEFYKMLLEKNTKDDRVDISFMYRNVKNSTYKKVVSSPGRVQAFLDAIKMFEDDDGVYDMTSVASKCTFCPYKKSCGK